MPESLQTVSPKKERDNRTHRERLLDLRDAFGVCKERAIRENKVNECSITKVAEKAGVPKLYLTGNKNFVEEGVAENYRAIGLAILQFREDFQNGKISTNEENRIKALEGELGRVKSSTYKYFLELETVRNAADIDRKALKEAENRILLLQSKLAEALSNHDTSGSPTPKKLVTPQRLQRTIISPDKHLFVGGEYKFGDDDLRHEAWLKSYDELDEALSRAYAKRLYVLVGLPCAGKSTWARDAVLYQDRHPIIFDSTNLTRYERENLLHRVKRFSDVRKCCVYFDTSIDVVRERNAGMRTSERQLGDRELNAKMNKLEPPDPIKEKWIDEMIVVRGAPSSF